MHNARRPDAGSMIACIAFIVVGSAAYVASNDFSPLGAVFPKTISALMIFFSALYLVLSRLKPRVVASKEGGSRGRQIGVALVMLGWAFALAPAGFLVSSVIAFVLLLVIANYDRWTARMMLVYGLVTALVVGGLYVLFRVALQVPLPQGLML